MNYQNFKNYILAHLKEKYPEEEYEIHVRKITKNNGLHLEGLCIFHKEENISPTIYLDTYYEKYVAGTIMAEIILSIEMEYENGMKLKPFVSNVESYYEAVRSQIIMRLVNYEKNAEILEDCPHIRFHDLAISFRWLAHWDDIGISTALITNKEMERWRVSKEQLYEDAMKNTKRIFPVQIRRLKEIMETSDMSFESGDFDLYVLTNSQGINGATSILYDGVLKDFARYKKSSFYLLPSSIHEMMICLVDSQISESMLLSLVKEANHMVVTMGEVLSDNIYFYHYEKDELFMIENYL